MDRESNQRMAPALHTTEHEAASTDMKNFKLSPASPSAANNPDKIFFEQMNGVLASSCEMDDSILSATDSVKNVNCHINDLQRSNPVKHPSYTSTTAGGDGANLMHSFLEKRNDVEVSINQIVHSGAGDAKTVFDTNGWDPSQKYLDTAVNRNKLGRTATHAQSNATNTEKISSVATITTCLSSYTASTPATFQNSKCTCLSCSHADDNCSKAGILSQSSDINKNMMSWQSKNSQKSVAVTANHDPIAAAENPPTLSSSQCIKTTVSAENMCRTDSEVSSSGGTASSTQAISSAQTTQSYDPFTESSQVVGASKLSDSENVVLKRCISSDVNGWTHDNNYFESHTALSRYKAVTQTVQHLIDSVVEMELLNDSCDCGEGTRLDNPDLMCKTLSCMDIVHPNVDGAQSDCNTTDFIESTESSIKIPTSTECLNHDAKLVDSFVNELRSSHIVPNSDKLTSHNGKTSGTVTQTQSDLHTETPISSYSVHTTMCGTNVISNSPLPVSHVADLQGLALGLVTGNHMQHLPQKLTNTLQELAASLTRRQDAKIAPEFSSSKCGNVNGESVKDEYNDSTHNIICNFEEIHAHQKLQHADTKEQLQKLQSQMFLLHARLNKLRAVNFLRHTHQQSNVHATRTGKLPSTVGHIGASKMWKQSSHYLRTNSRTLWPADQEVYGDDSLRKKRLPDIHSVHRPAKDLGIMKKELCNMRKRIDTDLTDSSSDEEDLNPVDSCVKSENSEALNATSQISTLPVHKTASWGWAHERSSIAHRWTWLDAQVTGLEFKIQHYCEMNRRLRDAKGEVQLEGELASKHTTHRLDVDARSHVIKGLGTTTAMLVGDFSTSDGEPANQLAKNSQQATVSRSGGTTSSSSEKPSSAARTRALKIPFRRRRLVKASHVSFLTEKKIKAPSVRNENSIMTADSTKHTPFHRADGRSRGILHSSVSTRAAFHDHCYHKILSTSEDVPLSLRLNGFMFTNNKKFSEKLKRYDNRLDKKNKRKQKEAKRKEERLFEKMKSRTRSATVVLERADKWIQSVGILQRHPSFEERPQDATSKKRRNVTQSVGDHGKRSRLGSVDSDTESTHHRSDGGTPVFDSSVNYANSPQYQAFLKRKRAADQAYDINNIVIPHGLSTARIEKLQYKEILTPGWRSTGQVFDDTVTKDKVTQEEDEAVSDEIFQVRHDRYEIMEKKKYMAYMEWSLNKKNGSRSMSRANLPLDDEASSFFYPSFRGSPTTPFSPIELPSPPTYPDPVTAHAAVVRSRRSSSDQSLHSNVSTSMLADRRRLPDSISSDDGHVLNRENSTYDSWETRCFPLNDKEYDELVMEPVVCLQKLSKGFETEQTFRPITAHPAVDTNTAPKHKTLKATDHPLLKRQHTAPHCSHWTRDDDRFSDDSTTSSVSSRRTFRAPEDVTHDTAQSRSNRHPHRIRHKPSSMRDDFVYYSEIDSVSDDNDYKDDVLSDDERKASLKKENKTQLESSGHWVAKSISRESTPRGSSSGDEAHASDSTSPVQRSLVLKIKKK